MSKRGEPSKPEISSFAPPMGGTSDYMEGVTAKVVMLGDSGVGKSSLVIRYVDEVFSPTIKSTIGASFFTKKFAVDSVKVKLQIWDTAGQERFRSLTPMFYRGAAAAVLVFDVTNESSFEKLKVWVKELRQNVDDSLILVIAANKVDLQSETRVPAKKVQDYATSIRAAVFETSAKDNIGVSEMFSGIAKQLVKMYKSPQPVATASVGSSITIDDVPKNKGCCS